jgi:hypothetical protein
MDATMAAMEPIVIRNGNQRDVGGELVSVSGTLPVQERDGTVRDRSLIRTPHGRTEVFEGDEIELGEGRYVVSIDVATPSITLTPVAL